MSKVVIHTHLPAAAKITLNLDASKVSFKPLGGGDGVPPGVTVLEGDQVVLYVAAQDFGVAIVDDERLVSVEGLPLAPGH